MIFSGFDPTLHRCKQGFISENQLENLKFGSETTTNVFLRVKVALEFISSGFRVIPPRFSTQMTCYRLRRSSISTINIGEILVLGDFVGWFLKILKQNWSQIVSKSCFTLNCAIHNNNSKLIKDNVSFDASAAFLKLADCEIIVCLWAMFAMLYLRHAEKKSKPLWIPTAVCAGCLNTKP